MQNQFLDSVFMEETTREGIINIIQSMKSKPVKDLIIYQYN